MYGVRSLVASDVLLSALDGHHVAVDYWSYCTLAEGQPSIASTHFPFDIVAFRYLVHVYRTHAWMMITLIVTWLNAFTHPGEKFRTWVFVNRSFQREPTCTIYNLVIQLSSCPEMSNPFSARTILSSAQTKIYLANLSGSSLLRTLWMKGLVITRVISSCPAVTHYRQTLPSPPNNSLHVYLILDNFHPIRIDSFDL